MNGELVGHYTHKINPKDVLAKLREGLLQDHKDCDNAIFKSWLDTCIKMINLLIEFGADPYKKGERQQDALDLASNLKLENIREYIKRKHDEKSNPKPANARSKRPPLVPASTAQGPATFFKTSASIKNDAIPGSSIESTQKPQDGSTSSTSSTCLVQ